MSRKKIQVKYCLLGHGYASLVAYNQLLEKNKHEDILILQNETSRQVFTIDHGDFHFSPLPIFPVKESELYKSNLFDGVPKQEPIKVDFSELLNFDCATFDAKEGSLAEFMIEEQGIDKNLCLGAKQWGEQMFEIPLSQVQSKIKRHYISPKGNTRLGYIEGRSLYNYAVDRLQPNILKHLGIERIDIEAREVHLKKHIVQFEKLVSSIPLHSLLEMCNLPFDYNQDHAGAYFCFFNFEKGFDQNQMLYDCNYNSDIIRIFSVTDNFLLVQLNGKKHDKVQIETLENRIQELVVNIEGLEYAMDLYMPMCYPLELVTETATLESIKKLKSNGVIPFGRFGNWEYSDLHELEWSLIL